MTVSTPNHTRDRAAIVTTAILRIVQEALRAWLYRGDAAMPSARAEIEAVLRDEFADVARMTRDEIRID